MSRLKSKQNNSIRRKHRTRMTVAGTKDRPRLSVNVSNRHISAQLIDDENSTSLAGYSSKAEKTEGNMTQVAETVGTHIAKQAKAKKIKKVAFDRGSQLYHGRIKALADAARKGGLEF